jgi:membrane fusion protein (multidrug efflux system)
MLINGTVWAYAGTGSPSGKDSLNYKNELGGDSMASSRPFTGHDARSGCADRPEQILPPATAPKNASPKNRHRFLLHGVLILILIAVSAIPTTAADMPPARVAVTKVFEKEVAPTTSLVGNVVFDQSAGISSEISGLIVDHRMIEGSLVRRGDILVQLNHDFITKDLEILKRQIAQNDIRIENAMKNLRRFETLYQQDAASEKTYDDLAFEARELQIEKERLQVTLAKKQLELEKSTIRAPFDGLILERNKNRGEWLSPGEPLCRLAAVDDVVVRVAMSEDLMPYVTVGQVLTFVVTAMGREFQGKVKAIVPDVDVKSKTFDIKVDMDYVPGLFQDMSAQVNVPTGPARRLKMIKRGALVRFQGRTFVYAVQDGVAKMMPIQVSAMDGEYLGVEAPHLAVGMPVVIDGNERLRPDQPVTVVDSQGKEQGH